MEDESIANDTATEKAEKNTGRVEAFSDGVFAIAITLLVLNLLAIKLPDAAITRPNELTRSLLSTLTGSWPIYLTYLLSFATILIMWIYHHRLFQALRKAETALLFSNGLLLLLVTAVPFPTALVGTYLTTPAASIACAIYAGFFVLINIAYDLLWWTVFKQHSDCPRLPVSLLFCLLGFPCYLIAAIVAFWIPILTICICGALWLVWAFTAPTQIS